MNRFEIPNLWWRFVDWTKPTSLIAKALNCSEAIVAFRRFQNADQVKLNVEVGSLLEPHHKQYLTYLRLIEQLTELQTSIQLLSCKSPS